MDAIRVARGVTGRDKIVKVEGGYHGHHDEVMVSMKPPLDEAGPADAPTPVPATAGITEAVLGRHDRHPVQRRRGPRAGAGRRRRRLLHRRAGDGEHRHLPARSPATSRRCGRSPARHGTLLIFDEVKTGITAGWCGATGALGVQPDLVALAKSIGGGLPVGAFGGTAECMDQITAGRVLHLGTYNGNPLCMAAAKAVLAEVCTPEATAGGHRPQRSRCSTPCQTIIDDAGLPAHTVQFGAKGCVTWSPTPVRNYRDYKATDFDLAFAQWIHGINRGVLLPPGLDEQWLISVMHTEDDAMRYADVFAEFVAELTA